MATLPRPLLATGGRATPWEGTQASSPPRPAALSPPPLCCPWPHLPRPAPAPAASPCHVATPQGPRRPSQPPAARRSGHVPPRLRLPSEVHAALQVSARGWAGPSSERFTHHLDSSSIRPDLNTATSSWKPSPASWLGAVLAPTGPRDPHHSSSPALPSTSCIFVSGVPVGPGDHS